MPMPPALFCPAPPASRPGSAEECARLLADRAARRRGGVAGRRASPRGDALNLESRLAQRVLSMAEGPYRDEDDLYALARGSPGRTGSRRDRRARRHTAQRSPLKSLNFAALRVKDGVCDRMRDAPANGRASTPCARPAISPPRRRRARLDLRRQLRRVALQARLARGQGRRAAQGDARRGDARGGRLARQPAEGGALTIRAAARDDRHRGGADRMDRRPGCAPLRLRAAAAFRAAAARRPAAHEVESGARVHPSAVPIFASDISFRMVDFASPKRRARRRRDAIEFTAATRSSGRPRRYRSCRAR